SDPRLHGARLCVRNCAVAPGHFHQRTASGAGGNHFLDRDWCDETGTVEWQCSRWPGGHVAGATALPQNRQKRRANREQHGFEVVAQSAVDVTRPEQRQKERHAVEKAQEKRAKQTSIIEFRGEQAFKEKELRTALKEEITTIENFGLSPARADDLAFFLEVFY